MTWEEMKQIDVQRVERESLKDLREISLEDNLTQEEKCSSFLSQIKNPYCCKVGELVIKLSFEREGTDWEERMREYIRWM